MRKIAEFLFAGFGNGRRWLMNRLVFLLMLGYGLEGLPLESIRKRGYEREPDIPDNLRAAAAPEMLYDIAVRMFDRAEKSRAEVLEKCRVLFQTASFLIPAAVFLAALSGPIPQAAWWPLGAAAAAVSATLVLVGYLFDVNNVMNLSVNREETAMPEDDLRRTTAGSLLTICADTNGNVALLVDVFRAARFFFLTACFMAVLGAVVAVAAGGGGEDGTLSERLRDDPELRELLKGEDGERGVSGAPGPAGPQGRRGRPGRDGRDGRDGTPAVVIPGVREPGGAAGRAADVPAPAEREVGKAAGGDTAPAPGDG